MTLLSIAITVIQVVSFLILAKAIRDRDLRIKELEKFIQDSATASIGENGEIIHTLYKVNIIEKP